MFTITIRHEGIDRHYDARTMFDAVMLFDALTRRFSRVELWEGKTLHREFNV